MALHVHHGLQAAADGWVEHCEALCKRLDVPLQVVKVRVPEGASIEAMARLARYDVFERTLGDGDVLMQGHHRDDQAETFLFRLLRGAGVQGLCAIPSSRPIGKGYLFRPLLDVAREELRIEIERAGLGWIEDPSNEDHRLARNYIRHRVLPVASERWPQASQSIVRAVSHLQEAQALLDELAATDLAPAASPSTWPWLPVPSLDFQRIRTLSLARQRNLMRYWLRQFGEQPETDHWEGWQSLRDAQSDAIPAWILKTGLLTRAGERVWWLSGLWLKFDRNTHSYVWPEPGEMLELPDNGAVRAAGNLPSGQFEIRYRRGGERLNIPGRGHRDLKRLLNESMLPAFVRKRIPLIYCDGELIAVANMPGLSALEAQRAVFEWTPPVDAH
jgi:tRNA(Ile)-lysidine synthase